MMSWVWGCNISMFHSLPLLDGLWSDQPGKFLWLDGVTLQLLDASLHWQMRPNDEG